MLVIIGIILAQCDVKDPKRNTGEPRPSLSQKIDSIAYEFLSHKKTVGFSIAILKNNDTLYNKGFGFSDTLSIRKTNTGTIFNLASISKLVGSIIALKIAQEGMLSLDQTLEELLPEFPNKEHARKIRLRHLMSMSSGLKEYAPKFDSIYLASAIPPSQTDLLHFFSQQNLDFEPGQFYKYSNSGFYLLPLILERATGETYESLIERVINGPTGLHIRLFSESQFDSNTSQFFEIHDGKIEFRPIWSWIRGDGGMSATAIELAHVPLFLRSGIIINRASFGQMISPTRINDDLYSDYGLGVKNGSFEGSRMWGHSGADKTYWSMMYFFPESEITIVTMVNTNNTSYDARELFVRVALTVLKKETPDYTESEMEDYNRQMYIGNYFRPGDPTSQQVEITMKEEDNHLYYVYDGRMENGERMYCIGVDEFWIEKWPTDRVKFVRNKDGKILALKEYYAGYFAQLRRKIE